MWDNIKQPNVYGMGFLEEGWHTYRFKSSNPRNMKKTMPRIIIIKLSAINNKKKKS